jgi:D-sedoheptulose 7-phosphate isomerase
VCEIGFYAGFEPPMSYQDILNQSIATLGSIRDLEAPLMQAVDRVSACFAAGHKLLTCGNGGSAADASHLAAEFVVRYVEDRRAYPAIALVDGGSTITAAANDYGYDSVFSRQVEAFGQPGDVLIAFTTSGKSPSILRAMERAKTRGLVSIAFLGRDGGPAKGLADVELIVRTQSTARIQEAHTVLIHMLCEMVEKRLGKG